MHSLANVRGWFQCPGEIAQGRCSTQCGAAERVGALPAMGVLARGGGLGARQGWSWLQSVGGSVLAAGEQATAGGTGDSAWEKVLETQT